MQIIFYYQSYLIFRVPSPLHLVDHQSRYVFAPKKERSFYKLVICGGRESEAKSEQSKKDFFERILTVCLIFSDFFLFFTVGFSYVKCSFLKKWGLWNCPSFLSTCLPTISQRYCVSESFRRTGKVWEQQRHSLCPMKGERQEKEGQLQHVAVGKFTRKTCLGKVMHIWAGYFKRAQQYIWMWK